MHAAVDKDIQALANPAHAKILQRFFKTGPGEYAEGDIFVGIKVPVIRQLVKKYSELDLKDIETLLHDRVHEKRILALFIMVAQFREGTPEQQKNLYDIYLNNTRYINNWDLVDLSAPRIIGPLAPIAKLKKLARSKDLWEKRIAMLSTFHNIYYKDPQPALQIAEILLSDKHDLIHKAVGWMLREVGKRCSQDIEENFLKKHYKTMPRTMLRYAIERFPEKLRKAYLKGII